MANAELPEGTLEDWKRVLGGRFEVRRSALLGRGAYAVVRRGRDLNTGKVVAVKFYADSGDDGTSGRPSEETLQTFRCGVKALQSLHCATPEEILERLRREEGDEDGRENVIAKRESMKGVTSGGQHVGANGATTKSIQGSKKVLYTSTSFGPMPKGSVAFDKALLNMRFQSSELFVQLVAFSCTPDGQPGLEDGLCYLIQDFGLENLDTHIADSHEFGKPMSSKEVCDILLHLTQAVAALHSFGLAHLDIKPSNLMRFKRGKQSIWKLIDMDGLCPSQSSMNPLEIQFTPMYCSPELALAVASEEPFVTVSRWMDIWSIGMSVLDCILLKSLFSSQYQQKGQHAFLSWLGALDRLDLPSEVTEFDASLALLLGSHVLQIMPSHRMSVLELLAALHRGLLPFSPSEGTFAEELPSIAPIGVQDERDIEDTLVAVLSKAFDTWDEHGNGTIPQEMLLKLLLKLSPNLGADRVLEMIEAADVCQDGMINHRKFVSWMFAK